MDAIYIFLLFLFVPLFLFFVIKAFYEKYKTYDAKCKLSGFEIARKFLDMHELKEMYIVEIKTGDLTDHYDAKQKVIRLSSDVYHGESIYSAAVALYQAGLALLDKDGDSLFKVKALFDPLFDFVYILVGIIFVMWAFLLDGTMLLVAIGLFVVALLYDLLMLPVGFQVTHKMMEQVSSKDIFSEEECSLLKKNMQFTAFVPITRVIVLINKGIKNAISSLKRR